MSTFDGKIREFPAISVDRFDGKNLDSSIFFLSHCHTDHMKGLFSQCFVNKLIHDNCYIYMSSVSARILSYLHPDISQQIKKLSLENVNIIPFGDREIAVKCIPAGHCPGSVMFLFESDHQCVLYTGDYRIRSSDIQKFNCFYDKFGKLKKIDKIYLDTTFFLESYQYLPSREDSLSELCKIISSWILQHPDNCVKLDCSARYGYEYVFKEIHVKCKMPVHVDEDKFGFYSAIPELDKCVTVDGTTTQIHSCGFPQKSTCQYCNPERLRIIKLSAFRWKNENFVGGISEVNEQGIFYVCYSTHASYEEGLSLINFLKPKDIHICVERPNDPESDMQLKLLVQKHLQIINNPIITTKEESNPKRFLTTNEINDYDEVRPQKIFKSDVILDSPPR